MASVALVGATTAPASPPASPSVSKACKNLAGKLVRQTRIYKRNELPPRVNAASTPVCFDLTGDGRKDVAFGILSGGTAGPTAWAVFRGVRTSSTRLARRYRKVTERNSGSKTLVLRRGSLLGVQNPIYKSEDANCCPTGGATRSLYRVRPSGVTLVRTVTLTPEQAGQNPE